MDVADSFIPMGGAVGLLPMVTYFFLIVAALAFAGLFIVVLISLIPVILNSDRSYSSLSQLLLPVVVVVLGIIYYVLQSYYHSVLAELVTITDSNDRQTLIRESFNALSQYRYMALFIVAPILMFQLLSLVPAQLKNKRVVSILVGGSSLLFFSEFLGQQSLSFDNEIHVGPFRLWGLLAVAQLGIILFTLNQLRQTVKGENQFSFQAAAVALTATWTIYLLSYFLTLTPVDCNYLQVALTLADLGSTLTMTRALYINTVPR